MIGPRIARYARLVIGLASCLIPLVGHAASSRWQSSRLHGSPEPPLPYTTELIYQGITWRSPLYVIEEPDAEALWVIEQKGAPNEPVLKRIENRPDVTDVTPIPGLEEWLVYGMTFDPDFANNRFVYFFQNGNTGHQPRGNRITRYRYLRDPDPHLDSDSRLTIIEWRSAGHDGGDLAFGPDGMLYITTGDGTSDSDGWVSGQTLDDLLGAVLRIDVRNASAEQPYRIPPDNPFLQHEGARPEIWAYGLRNPWRMGIDPASNQIWVGNNGQDLWETAHLIGRGENYGWSVYEGSYPFYPNRQLGPTPHVLPTIEHPHSEFRSLTGGVVYRGSTFPDLDGAYIYGDYSTGRIWGAKHDGNTLVWHRELADTTLALASFRSLRNGDLLLVDHLGKAIHRLEKNPPPASPSQFPHQLSQTGLFEHPLQQLSPKPGVIPYSVNAAAWTDGAQAQRWMAVPAQGDITFSAAAWTFPNDSALVQTLSLPGSDQKPARKIETRILVRQQNEWAGYSYLWNDAQTEATLVPRDGLVTQLVQPDGSTQSWQVPSRAECAVCHSRAANYVLGISGANLNDTPGESSDLTNQLYRLEQQDLFSGPLPQPLPDPIPNPYDTDTPLEDRARAYLHTNCSSCHVEAGGGNARMTLNWGRALPNMQVINARPQHATFGLPNAMIVTPGVPESSVLVHRLGHRGVRSGQMPPLGTQRVDEAALQLFREWIRQMPTDSSESHAWTLNDFPNLNDQLATGRNYLEGRRLFTATGCIQCHQYLGEGGSVGPTLDGVGHRLSAYALLESLVDPSKTIAPKYRVPDSDPSISTMPAGIVDSLSQEQVLDLLYYLQRNGRPRVAAVVTEYRHNSHADIIVSRLLQTDTLDGKGKDSPLELVSLYTDQRPESDTSRMLAASHRFEIYDRIEDTLTLGTQQLAVDGILLIAEHGDYPKSPTGNIQYPKRRFWNAIETVFEANQRGVPVFVDKHLADNWTDARYLYDSAARWQVPLMAGSSLPTTWRRPPADVPHQAHLKELVAISFHTTDAYGFHALEFIQALAEQRHGGETGIVQVQGIQGEAVWDALDAAQVDPELFAAAWSRQTTAKDSVAPRRSAVRTPRLFTIDYQDGLRVQLVELNGAANEWTAAWRYQDNENIESTLFWTQEGRPGMHFTWLLHGIEKMILTGNPSWPAERTLFTSGTLDAMLQSLVADGQVVPTPYLNRQYQSDWRWQEPPPPPPMRPWSEQ